MKINKDRFITYLIAMFLNPVALISFWGVYYFDLDTVFYALYPSISFILLSIGLKLYRK